MENEEVYNLVIQTKPYPKVDPITGELCVYFKATSKTQREYGKRGMRYVTRHCYCRGGAWQMFHSKAKAAKLKDMSYLEAENYLRNLLCKFKEVKVKGVTEFGADDATPVMLVRTVEIVHPEKAQPFAFDEANGFLEKEEVEF